MSALPLDEAGAPDRARLGIRIMERVPAEVDADRELRELNIDCDLWAIFRDVLEDELGADAFRAACARFSENPPPFTRQLLAGELP